MSVDYSPQAVAGRLRRMSDLSDLASTRRLDAKVGMRPEDVEARLRQQSELRDACLAWRACGLASLPDAAKGR